jgi:hypothetical protein
MVLEGNETRSYNNPKDPLRGSFCTVPVRYEFRDPGIRSKAEKVRRKTCGTHCATPYPVVVQECVKQIVSVVKNRYPNNFVRVTVDTKNMVFKVALKPPDDAIDPRWQYRENDIPILPMALDIDLKRAPKDFKLEIPESPKKRNRSRTSASEMEVTGDSNASPVAPPPLP